MPDNIYRAPNLAQFEWLEHGFGKLEVANLSMVGWSGIHLTEIGAAVAVGNEAIDLALRAVV